MTFTSQGCTHLEHHVFQAKLLVKATGLITLIKAQDCNTAITFAIERPAQVAADNCVDNTGTNMRKQ